MCVCVCVFMCVCMCVCMYVYIFAHPSNLSTPSLVAECISLSRVHLPAWRVAVLLALGTAALLFVGTNAAADVARLLGAAGASRWQRG